MNWSSMSWIIYESVRIVAIGCESLRATLHRHYAGPRADNLQRRPRRAAVYRFHAAAWIPGGS